MSRIGRQPIQIPAGVTVSFTDRQLTATGPKGELQVPIAANLTLAEQEGVLRVTATAEDATTMAGYGLTRTLIANAIAGVHEGFTKQLEINGVGFRASVAGQTITLSLGFSHPIEYQVPQDITAAIEKNVITISGADKQLVGQVAADIRELKKPEPYKGKGIKYVGEHIRRKAGKTATKG